MRRIASHEPFKAPYFDTDSTAYWEQVGTYRQDGGVMAETYRWYTRISPKTTCFIAISPYCLYNPPAEAPASSIAPNRSTAHLTHFFYPKRSDHHMVTQTPHGYYIMRVNVVLPDSASPHSRQFFASQNPRAVSHRARDGEQKEPNNGPHRSGLV